MKDAAIVLIVGATVIGLVGIGAYLVMQDHPWFGLLAMMLAGSIRVKSD